MRLPLRFIPAPGSLTLPANLAGIFFVPKTGRAATLKPVSYERMCLYEKSCSMGVDRSFCGGKLSD